MEFDPDFSMDDYKNRLLKHADHNGNEIIKKEYCGDMEDYAAKNAILEKKRRRDQAEADAYVEMLTDGHYRRAGNFAARSAEYRASRRAYTAAGSSEPNTFLNKYTRKDLDQFCDTNNTFVLPPSWDLTPNEFVKLVKLARKPVSWTAGLTPRNIILAPGFGSVPSAIGIAVDTSTVNIVSLMFLVPVLTCAGFGFSIETAKQARAKAVDRLENLPLAAGEPLNLGSLHRGGFAFYASQEILGYLTKLEEENVSSGERHRVLTRLYNHVESRLAKKENRKIKKIPTAVGAKNKVYPPVGVKQSKVASKPAAPKPVVKPVVKPAPDQVAHNLFDQALKRFNNVRDAWTDIITDPLNALDHAPLFDVSVPRTASFITKYGEITDLVKAIGVDSVTFNVTKLDKIHRDKFIALSREVQTCWDGARSYAVKAGFSLLDDKSASVAVRARKLLQLALDEAASVHERINAANQAVKLLESIHQLDLPQTALREITATRMLALPE